MSMWKRMLIAMISCVCMVHGSMNVWRYEAGKKLKDMHVSLRNLHQRTFTASVQTTGKTPDGDNVLRIVADDTATSKSDYGVQLCYDLSRPIEPEARYRLWFWCRASQALSFPLEVARDYRPFSLVAASRWTANVTPEWTRFDKTFTGTELVGGALSAPRMNLGRLPPGAVLELGPIHFGCLDALYDASVLSDTWSFAVGEESSMPVDRIPEGVEKVAVNAERKGYDVFERVGRLGKAGEAAYFYQEFEVEQAGMLTVGVSADWYFECFANGVSVKETLKRGNMSNKYVPEDNIFNIPVKAGRNLLAFKVRSGSAGWRFVLGKVKAERGNIALKLLFKPTAGKEYRPVDDSRFLEVRPGTALDFSRLTGPREVAGTHGRLIVGKNGKPVFEKRPDVPVRFMGPNWLPSGMWRKLCHEWDKPTMDRFADALMRRGYNCIRIHIPEVYLIGWDNFIKYRFKELKPEDVPTTMEGLVANLDEGNWDRLDYLFHAFKSRGIYVNFDMAGRKMFTLNGKVEHEDSFKGKLFFDERYRTHWKLFAQYFMNRVNRYTGVAYKDEPALILVNFINEQDLRFASGLEFLTEGFRTYLRKKYGSDAALSKAWGVDMKLSEVPHIREGDLRPADQRAIDTGDFLITTMQDMSTWFLKTLREAGYPGLVNHWDMIMRTLELPARGLMPVIAQHTYFAHPNPLKPSGLIKKSVRPNSFVGNHGSDCSVNQDSSLNSSYFRAASLARFFDRPYFNTEFSHASPNRFRHERGLYFASYAGLQDWDALSAHADTVGLHLDPFLSFDGHLDPISRINEALAALIFLRRDVKTAPHTVGLRIENKNMFPKYYLSALDDDYGKLSMITRVGLLYPEVKPLEPVGSMTPDTVLVPKEFAYLSVSSWYVQADNSGKGKAGELIAQLKAKGVLPQDNATDVSRQYYESETGELRLDGAAETMLVCTPRLEGVIVKDGKQMTSGLLSVSKCSQAASIAIASLEHSKTLKDTNRLLLTVATNAFNTGQIFDTKAQHVCMESGNHPALIESVSVSVSLSNGRAKAPRMWSLHFNGERAEEVAVRQEGGVLKMDLDTSALTHGAGFFEIVYE